MAALGEATNLAAGSLIPTIPDGTRYWYIQNQDITPLKVTFPSGSGFGPIVLNAADALGAAGDFMDSVKFPFFGASMTLTSSTSTHQFGAGATKNASGNDY